MTYIILLYERPIVRQTGRAAGKKAEIQYKSAAGSNTANFSDD